MAKEQSIFAARQSTLMVIRAQTDERLGMADTRSLNRFHGALPRVQPLS
jgi:hypothetical protein